MPWARKEDPTPQPDAIKNPSMTDPSGPLGNSKETQAGIRDFRIQAEVEDWHNEYPYLRKVARPLPEALTQAQPLLTGIPRPAVRRQPTDQETELLIGMFGQERWDKLNDDEKQELAASVLNRYERPKPPPTPPLRGRPTRHLHESEYTITTSRADTSISYILGVAAAQYEDCLAYLGTCEAYADYQRSEDAAEMGQVADLFTASAIIIDKADKARADLATLTASRQALTEGGLDSETGLLGEHDKDIAALQARIERYDTAIAAALEKCTGYALAAAERTRWAMTAQKQLDTMNASIATVQGVEAEVEEPELAALHAATEQSRWSRGR